MNARISFFLIFFKAHFMSPARRSISVELPPKLQTDGKDNVGHLLRAMYGTRNAAMCWEAEIADLLVNTMGFVQGKASPCNFYHAQRCIRTTVHGDDFESLGPMDSLKWFSETLGKRWIISDRGILGPPEVRGTIQETRHLNRIITWSSEGFYWEPDPRHAELVIAALGVKGGHRCIFRYY